MIFFESARTFGYQTTKNAKDGRNRNVQEKTTYRPIHTRGFAPGACSRLILYLSVHPDRQTDRHTHTHRYTGRQVDMHRRQNV